MHEHFRGALEQCDVALVRKMWSHIAPNMPQPQTDHDALVQIHYARTLAVAIKFRLRAYSHCWLSERGLPSGMPDWLKPRAQRMYPVVVSSVGIAVRGNSEVGRRIAPIIQRAMSDAVNDAYAEGRQEPSFVKARMMEARQTTIGKLLGR